MEIIYQLTPDQVQELHGLYQKEWWTKGRTLEETRQCVECSQLCIGLVDANGSLKGFTRVITDFVFKAFIFDVIVSEEYRGTGLGSRLIDLVKNYPELRSVKHFELYCLPELVPFYEKHEFTTKVGSIQLLRYKNPSAQ